MTDDRRYDRSTAQVYRSPKCSEHSDDEGSVGTLGVMACAERDARDDQPDRWSSQGLLKAVQQERTLCFFPKSSGDDDDESKPPAVARCPDQGFEWVVFNGVKHWKETLDGRQQPDSQHHRHDGQRPHPYHELSPNGALAQEQCLRLFAVGAEEKEDEPDQQPGIDERHPHDEAEAEIAARIERTVPEGRKRGAERSLGGVVGAHEDFKKRHQAPSRGGLARRRG